MTDVKNREAGEKQKGFRLQKLRAIELLLDRMEQKGRISVCAATEFKDDVYYKEVLADGTVKIYTEGDKNYDPEKAFSFSAKEVRNSVVILIDCWLEFNMSDTVFFGFYTNIKIAKEYNVARIKELKITLPDKPMLQLLSERNYKKPNLLEAAKKILLDEYKSQYDINSRNYKLISKWTNKQWIDFFDRIDWKFEQADDKELEKRILEKVRNCSIDSVSIMPGKERMVLALLEHEFEVKQSVQDHFGRLVTVDFLESTILKVAANVAKKSDPVYKLWNEIDEPVDKRNLSMKIEAVCKQYSKKRIGLLARRAMIAKIELEQTHHEFSSAFRFRLYSACEEKLYELIDGNEGYSELDVQTVNVWFDTLYTHGIELIKSIKEDYSYELQNSDLICNTILELFDACYLSFEDELYGI